MKYANKKCLLVAAVTLAGASAVRADNGIDNLTLRAFGYNIAPAGALNAFAYNPNTDTAYVASTSIGEIYQVTGLLSGSVNSTVQIGATQLYHYEWSNGVDGNGNPIYPPGGVDGSVSSAPSTFSGGQPTISGLVFNPLPIGGIPAYARVWATDQASTVAVTANSVKTNYLDYTKRVYSWDLTPATPFTNLNAAIPHLTTLATNQNFATALGVTATGSDNIARQPVWSSDGQSLYIMQSAGYPGLWKMNPTTGALNLLVADGSNFEPAVVGTPQGDHVYVRGSTTNGNTGGLSYYNVNGNTVSGPVSVKTLADMQSFLETTSTTSFGFASAVALADGTILVNYIGGSTNSSAFVQSGPSVAGLNNPAAVLVAIAPDGSMYKVTDERERGIAYGSPSATNLGASNNMYRMQAPLTTTINGANGNFTRPMIMYDDFANTYAIATVTVFKPGDFNRDNSVDASDIALFQAALGVRNSAASTANLMFDLNGNGSVDWKDVKLLQQFYAFPDGDANMDKKVNQTDLNTFESNWQNTNNPSTWIMGKFDGGAGPTPWTDTTVNTVGARDLTIISANWDSGVAASGVTRFIADFTIAKVTAGMAGISLAATDVATLAARSSATGGTKVIVTPSLAIASGGKIDLVNNDFILKSSAVNVATDFSTVAGFVATGRAGGTWSGTGLTSSAAQSNVTSTGHELTTLAVVVNGSLATPFTTFDDVPVDAYSILVKYTYPGDTTLKGSINFDDYLAMDYGLLKHLSGWAHGDFNGDGTVNAADYALADYAYLHQGGTLAEELISEHAALFGDAYTSLVPSLIPEPGTLATLSAGLFLLSRRGRSTRRKMG